MIGSQLAKLYPGTNLTMHLTARHAIANQKQESIFWDVPQEQTGKSHSYKTSVNPANTFQHIHLSEIYSSMASTNG